MTPEARLAALLAPVTLPEFFDRHWEREPLVVRGNAERARGLITLERVLEAAAAGAAGRRGSILLHPHHLEAAERPTMQADGRTVTGPIPLPALRAYAERGHPILWTSARGATPALDALARDLAEALGAHVHPNVYATGSAGTPLDFHFDAHEVLAVQCEGVKEWRISRVRADRPLDLPQMAAGVRQTLADRRAEALAATLMTFTVEPGDVVYVPRGQFHSARTPAGRSLHVTFGITPLSGLDVLAALADLALAEPLFRDFLPVRPRDLGGAARREHVARLRERLVALAGSDALERRLDALLAERIARSGPPA